MVMNATKLLIMVLPWLLISGRSCLFHARQIMQSPPIMSLNHCCMGANFDGQSNAYCRLDVHSLKFAAEELQFIDTCTLVYAGPQPWNPLHGSLSFAKPSIISSPFKLGLTRSTKDENKTTSGFSNWWVGYFWNDEYVPLQMISIEVWHIRIWHTFKHRHICCLQYKREAHESCKLRAVVSLLHFHPRGQEGGWWPAVPGSICISPCRSVCICAGVTGETG